MEGSSPKFHVQPITAASAVGQNSLVPQESPSYTQSHMRKFKLSELNTQEWYSYGKPWRSSHVT